MSNSFDKSETTKKVNLGEPKKIRTQVQEVFAEIRLIQAD